MSRYSSRKKVVNNSEEYEQVREDRGVQNIVQYNTARLRYPTEEEILTIRTVSHIWSQGDKFWRLAALHYGDSKLWWVIAQFNRKPTEASVDLGDIIKIPIDLGIILGILS